MIQSVYLTILHLLCVIFWHIIHCCQSPVADCLHLYKGNRFSMLLLISRNNNIYCVASWDFINIRVNFQNCWRCFATYRPHNIIYLQNSKKYLLYSIWVTPSAICKNGRILTIGLVQTDFIARYSENIIYQENKKS